MKPDYDTTIARMAGNIAAGLINNGEPVPTVARRSVDLATAIVDILRERAARDLAPTAATSKGKFLP